MTNATEPVRQLWQAIADKDWEAVKNVVADDCIFLDVPLGPSLAARGPDDIVRRLRGGLENELLVDWANRDLLLLTNGVDVMYEHVVTYTSADGRTAKNPIVSVHKVVDGKVAFWKDYWDFNAIANTAWFQASLATPDMSWVFDATGMV